MGWRRFLLLSSSSPVPLTKVKPMDLTALQNISRNLRDIASPKRTAFTLAGSTTIRYGVEQDTTRDKKYSDYGGNSGIKMILSVEIADFQTLPTDNTEITINSVVYQILSIQKDPAGIKAFFSIGDRTA
ncbi:MAG TPA: hypothetical protein DET40_01980 [Lentisphaeria bacterium]|nr:MAG: hypothetical protein A2X45_11005 [Lentisphaerae bacterium GWF2_50_93]HCE42301.1 hypothetical protein [Lentisphaeria bacterium]